MDPASRGHLLEEPIEELNTSNAAQEQQVATSTDSLQQQLPTNVQHTLPQHLRIQIDQVSETHPSSAFRGSFQQLQHPPQWQGAQNVMTPKLNMSNKQFQASISSQRTFQLSNRSPSPTRMDPSTLALWQQVQPNVVQYEYQQNYLNRQGYTNQFADNMIQMNMNSHAPQPLPMLEQQSVLTSMQGEAPSTDSLLEQSPMSGMPFSVGLAQFRQDFAFREQNSVALMQQPGVGHDEVLPTMQTLWSQHLTTSTQNAFQEANSQNTQKAAKRPPSSTLLDQSESSSHSLTKLSASFDKKNVVLPHEANSVQSKKASPSDPQTSKIGAQPKQIPVTTFPGKLMQAIMNHGSDDIVAWLPDGKSFVIVDSASFCSQVLGKVLKETKYSSFVRKLHRWGFVRLTSGIGTDCFHHPQFQRNKIELAAKITSLTKNSKNKDTRSKSKPPSLAGVEKFVNTQAAVSQVSESAQRLQESQGETKSPTDATQH
eukprot:Nitzschia sp. Nitz4//scaffold1_size375055//54875//56551//NITZ4_000221-RA/size375055-augustus-gene-0.706-mRNA-1//-1//CDS//3329540880//2751//frame0